MNHPVLSAGRVAVVTGAASGIGLSAAKNFASLSMRVCMVDVAEDALVSKREQVVAAAIASSTPWWSGVAWTRSRAAWTSTSTPARPMSAYSPCTGSVIWGRPGGCSRPWRPGRGVLEQSGRDGFEALTELPSRVHHERWSYSKRNASPARTTRPAEGSGKCAVQTNVSVSQ